MLGREHGQADVRDEPAVLGSTPGCLGDQSDGAHGWTLGVTSVVRRGRVVKARLDVGK